PANQGMGDMINCRLRRTTRLSISLGGVLTVFDNIEIKATQVLRAKRGDMLGDLVKVHRIISTDDLRLYRLRTLNDKFIKADQLIDINAVGHRIKVVGIGKQEA